MTAQVVVMNKEAVALASDSAVTVAQGNGEEDSKQKVFASANKLFALSKCEPVGIMFHGSAEFMNIPLETVIKVYRETLGPKTFKTLKRYAMDFVRFLDGGNPIFPDSIQRQFALESFYSYFTYVRSLITKEVQATIDRRGRIARRNIEQLVGKVIREQYELWNATKNIPSIPANFNDEVIGKYGEAIDKEVNEVFEELPLSALDLTRLRVIAGSLFSKYPKDLQREKTCGVVIAGFGRDDIFPSLAAFAMEGVVNNRLKHTAYDFSTVSHHGLAGAVLAFAQGEVVSTFMEGIAPDCKTIEASAMSQAFKEYADSTTDILDRYNAAEKQKMKAAILSIGRKGLRNLMQKLERYRDEHHTDPVTTVVAALPKDELAAMAESLVNLTSLKRRYTMEAETVGGAIDVAVISKGDGFIWIKRKHYFEAELNPAFFQRYHKEA